MSQKQILYGIHTITSLLTNYPERLIRLYCLDDKHEKNRENIIQQAKKNNIPIEWQTRAALDRMTEGENHQGVAALCDKTRSYTEQDIVGLLDTARPPLVLILDGIQDPHNLGACFRSADAASVNFIIAPKNNAVGLTPTVSKVATGAVEFIPFVQVTNLIRAMEILKEAGVWIYGADGEATQSLYESNFTSATALVMGAEGAGLRRLTREHCDVLLQIPMHGRVASLNVSVATGIFLYEVVRQRACQPR